MTKENIRTQRGWITVEEVVSQLGVERWTIYKLVDNREIGHVRIGNRILFTQEMIDAYLSSHTFPAVNK